MKPCNTFRTIPGPYAVGTTYNVALGTGTCFCTLGVSAKEQWSLILFLDPEDLSRVMPSVTAKLGPIWGPAVAIAETSRCKNFLQRFALRQASLSRAWTWVRSGSFHNGFHLCPYTRPLFAISRSGEAACKRCMSHMSFKKRASWWCISEVHKVYHRGKGLF